MIRTLAAVGICIFALHIGVAESSASTARYTVTFNAEWSQSTHPNAYPPGAHFSPLIGGIHNDQVSFWTPGELASPGIEQMAEVGGTSTLSSEVQAAINSATALSIIQGNGIVSPGSTAMQLEVTEAFPLVTLVSMVAPTPDWFIGVHGLNLRDGNQWSNVVTVDLFPYDAGTEQGTGFSLSNPDTTPHESIALLGFPFASTDPRLGTFTFTRIFAGRSIGDYNDDGVINAADYTVWRNTLGEVGSNLPADGNVDGKIDPEDYGIWRNHFGELVSGAEAESSTIIPEPSATLLVISAVALIGFRRSR